MPRMCAFKERLQETFLEFTAHTFLREGLSSCKESLIEPRNCSHQGFGSIRSSPLLHEKSYRRAGGGGPGWLHVLAEHLEVGDLAVLPF